MMKLADKAFAGLFQGKHVLVTGASMGIGLAVAKGFARAGATLSILAENDAIHSAAEEIAATGTRAANVLQCDIADAHAVAQSIGRLEKIDVLVNVAGYQPLTPILDPDPIVDENFRRVMDVNVNGAWHVTRAAIRRMERGGKIVFTSSIWGKIAVAEFAGYVASKHATLGLMRALAIELAPKGINVNAICPGWVGTEGALWTARIQAKASGKSLDGFLAEVTGEQLLPGLMAPEAMVPIYLFLASGLADDITGQAYNVDRGNTFG
jgi:NAD(P)-dependent dehydrogenase (short-subunit alcohol dehydrogenase family)